MRARQHRRYGERHEDGASAVELALVLPLLVALLLGMINIGVILMQKASMNSAVRTGARFATVNVYASATNPHTCGRTITHAEANAPTLGGTPTFSVFRGQSLATARTAGALCTTSTSTTLPCTGAAPGDHVYVVANLTSRLFIPAPQQIINTDIPLESVGAYRCEYS